MKYAGCNYWINQGKHEDEPLGTAQSMHDCEGCSEYDICGLKRDTETWEYNEKVKAFLDNEFKKLIATKELLS